MTMWGKFLPINTKPIAFTLCGSDTGTIVHSLVYQHAQNRICDKNKVRTGRVIFMSDIYGAGRGEYSGVNRINIETLMIKSFTLYSLYFLFYFDIYTFLKL